MLYDTIIVGAGIAGLTAAIYASRKRMKFEVLAEEFGGQFLESGEVSNYPGIVNTTGVEFNKKMKEQMEFNNIKVRKETVKNIQKLKKKFKVITDKKRYDAKTVILATGARAKKLEVPGEKEFSKKGVTYCSICDGPLFSGMDVAIVGGGDSAMEAVDFMKDIASKIYLIVRGKKLGGQEYLQEKVKKNKKVKLFFEADTEEIIGDVMVSGLRFKHKGKEKKLDVRGVIIEIGRIPNTENFKDLLAIDKKGHILIDCQTRTSVPGIFSAGDCASGYEYQYVIAAGQGSMALIKAARHIAENR